ncbi:MAG: hypothetical protein G01um101413_825 [Parcubacteria group bacterium Gr01-1014_13]|nr:MAG: hypothetical protein G01um101413_825 [Parcubacteria group bacterium Gr01-1014_13]
MNDRELVEQMKAKILPRIRDLMVSRYKEATTDEQMAENVPGWDPSPSDPVEPSAEVLEWMLSAPLTDVAVHLLWTVTAASTNGTFVANDENVASAIASIDQNEVARFTGFKPEDVPFVISQMAESLVEIIRERNIIYIDIDRQPFRLVRHL